MLATLRVMPPMQGELAARRIPRLGFYLQSEGGVRLPEETPFLYRQRTNWLELALRGRLAAKGFWRGLHGSGILGIGRVYASVFRGAGGIEHFGLLGTKSITNAAVTYLRDDFNNASGGADVSLFNFHGCGTGTNAENVTDTALQTESTTALNPDSTRATGTRSVPGSNQYASVGTLTFDAGAAVTEHGVFTTSGTGTGTMWDRTQFTAINVLSGDSIQFTYTVTLTAGG